MPHKDCPNVMIKHSVNSRYVLKNICLWHWDSASNRSASDNQVRCYLLSEAIEGSLNGGYPEEIALRITCFKAGYLLCLTQCFYFFGPAFQGFMLGLIIICKRSAGDF